MLHFVRTMANTLFTSSSKIFMQQPKEKWTWDVLRLMAAVVYSALLIIAGMTSMRHFNFRETLPIYIVVIVISISLFLTYVGLWKITRFIPSVLCFCLATYGSLIEGFSTLFVLFFALSVLLSGMLINGLARWITVGLSALTCTLISSLILGVGIVDQSPQIITFISGLFGIGLLQWYYDYRIQASINAQVESNRTLSNEIDHRRGIERKLRDQEAQLRRLADNTTDFILEIDQNGMIQYASPSHLSGLGFRVEELIGTNAFDLIHPDDRQFAEEAAVQATLNKNPTRKELRSRNAKGEYLWLEVSGTPLFNELNEPTGFVLASRDISIQKETELAILQSETKFRNIIEAMPLGVHIYTFDDEENLIFSGHNQSANHILGVDHQAFHGKTIVSAFPGLASTDIPENYRKIASDGGLWKKEDIHYASGEISGSYEVHAFQASPGNLVVVFADITERLKASQALKQSEEKFATAFYVSPDSINLNRLSDGVYLDINQGFNRLTGYSREDVVGKSSLDLAIWVDPTDRMRLVNGLKQNGEVENLQAQFRRKNGEIGIGLMSARLVEMKGEACILSITRDITDFLKAETSLREAHARLEEAYNATLQGWASALQLREKETAEHSRRVVDLTLEMACALGISDEDKAHIERGALLHDIGKMGVPDNILLKPGPLTPEEWVIMRQHPQFAYDLLAPITYLQPAIEIPYCHHERWDGEGYPQGLHKNEIPLAARIFSIADVYDALLSSRPYRPAWTKKDALHYLGSQKGKQFDAQLVDLFIGMID